MLQHQPDSTLPHLRRIHHQSSHDSIISQLIESPENPVRFTTGTSPKVTNGPTEALNNLIKRIKRAAFGLPNFANYRIRALLYAGKPNWDLLATVTPH